MKSWSIGKWCMGLGLLVALPFAGGCVQDVQSNAAPAVTLSNAVATAPASDAVAATTASDTNTAPAKAALDIAEAPYQPVSAPKAPPASVRTNGPVGEVVRMAESGVDEDVLLSYVTNSPSIYSLSADEIIYLNDVGVPSTVVTAMLQHDQGLRAGPTTDFQAAAPQPQQPMPAPAEVAPQSTAPPPAPAGQVAQEAPPPPATVNNQVFYDTLSPYGSWVNIDGYGQVWQPTTVVANPGWSPYVNGGHWIYTDAGWYWVSDYSWGWAPFHYGRWFRHYRLGWCWYPDTYWGPSWVTWRYTDGYCGWAPLPPGAWYTPGIGMTYWGSHVGIGFTFGLGYDCFSFVSWGRFHDHHLHHYRVDHDYGRRIYHDSVVATRYDGNRHFASNHGLPVDRVARGTGTEVRKVAIREVSTPASRGVRNERLAGDGRSVAVYRPRLAESTRPSGPETRLASSTRPGRENTAAVNARNVATSRATPATVSTAPVTTATKAWERPVPATQRDARPAVASNRDAARTIQRPAAGATAASSANPAAGTSSTRIIGRQPDRPVANSSFSSRPVNNREVASANVPQSPAATATPSATRSGSTVTSRSVPATSPAQSTTTQPRTTSDWQRNPGTAQGTWNRGNTVSPNTTRTAPSYQAPVQPSQNSTYSAPSRGQETPRYAPQPSYQAPARIESPRATTPSYSAPQTRSYSAPEHSTPTYSAPAPRSYSAPAASSPSYSAPAPRSYSAPPASSAPSYSAPSRSYSAPAPSSSGGSSGGGDRSGSSRGSRPGRD